MSTDTLTRTAEVVNLAKYPLDRDGAEREKLVQACRDGIREFGCFVLPNFVTADAIARVREETDAVASKSTLHSRYRTSYQSRGGDQNFPSIHPRNILHLDRYRITRQSVMTPGCVLTQIYQSDHLLKLLEGIFEKPMQRVLPNDSSRSSTTTVAYEGITVNTQEHGDSLIWHFDNNDFVVTIGIERPEGGGEFQYVPFIRSDEDERYDDIMSVFLGEHPAVRSVMLDPGTLVGFAGRRSIHRVSPIYGKGRRVTSIMLFNDRQEEASRARVGEFRI